MDGATNGQRFLSYVTHTLVPALTPGDTVVMDNLAAHKVAGVRQVIEAAGAHLRYLPAYSPDLNPIENAFAKLKALCKGRSKTRPLLRHLQSHLSDWLWPVSFHYGLGLPHVLGMRVPHTG